MLRGDVADVSMPTGLNDSHCLQYIDVIGIILVAALTVMQPALIVACIFQ